MSSRAPSAAPSLVLGHTGLLRALQRFILSPTEVQQHKHIIGLTGVGKSKFICTLCAQLLRAGTQTGTQMPFGLVDPHTDLGTDLIALLLDSGFFDDPRAFDRLWY